MTDSSARSASAPTIEQKPPEEIFGVLAHELRIRILRTVMTIGGEASFAEILDQVDTADSGRFNYHLNQLIPHFVRRTTDGYEVTQTGRRIIGTIYMGTYTATASIDPIPIEDECPACGAGMIVEYHDEFAQIRCTECDEATDEWFFPPGSIDQFEPDELPFAIFRWRRHILQRAFAGFCPTCAGRMEGRLVESQQARQPGDRTIYGSFECRRCGRSGNASVNMIARYHPGVEGMFVEHGLDPSTVPFWRIKAEIDNHELTIRSRDPLRVDVQLTLGNESVSATINENAVVEDVRRDSAENK